jgi:hypothetical protein
VVAGGGGDWTAIDLAGVLPFVAFWVVGVTEAVQDSAGAQEVCKEVGNGDGEVSARVPRLVFPVYLVYIVGALLKGSLRKWVCTIQG